MKVEELVNEYIDSQPGAKCNDMRILHSIITEIKPENKLWYLDGKNSEGKVVSNPNIGYGAYTIKYADGTEREFYQVGMSANTTGISIYIMGIDDKKYLAETFGQQLGKATVTGYCIKFKKLEDINTDVLKTVIKLGFEPQPKGI